MGYTYNQQNIYKTFFIFSVFYYLNLGYLITLNCYYSLYLLEVSLVVYFVVLNILLSISAVYLKLSHVTWLGQTDGARDR